MWVAAAYPDDFWKLIEKLFAVDRFGWISGHWTSYGKAAWQASEFKQAETWISRSFEFMLNMDEGFHMSASVSTLILVLCFIMLIGQMVF